MASKGFQLLPCKKDVCQECAVDHKPNEPHNPQSMYYQYKFFGEHGRWPTWKDAIAHCEPKEVREMLREELILRQVWDPRWDQPEGEVPDVMPAEDGSIGTVTTIPLEGKDADDPQDGS